MAQNTRTGCTVAGCQRSHCARGYCKMHYYRFRRTGDIVATQFRSIDGICRVDECGRPIRAKALCTLHYDRLARKGDVGPVGLLRRKRKIGDTRVDADGYVLVYRPDYPGIRPPYYIQEHRLVMERILGRQLTSFETAHHRNGIRADNSESNLELWTTRQPAGQRPEDLAAWFVEFYPVLVEVEQRKRGAKCPSCQQAQSPA